MFVAPPTSSNKALIRKFILQNLAVYDPSVLKAFSPVHSFRWFIRNGEEGWKSLGAILLAFTGVEALFADLGAFSARLDFYGSIWWQYFFTGLLSYQ